MRLRDETSEAPVHGLDSDPFDRDAMGRASMKRRILVVDDDAVVSASISARSSRRTGSRSRRSARAVRRSRPLRERLFHLMITDLRLPDMNGIELLTTVRAERLPFGVIVMTAYGDTQVALDAMKAGADDFVTKPLRARPPPDSWSAASWSAGG